ncbi:MAG: DNA double-strand break repair nuclease NurA [Actinobacteria bacterium]|nr:DNA double-strand break repair nuclease NurA [Actinomycetota bacterium]
MIEYDKHLEIQLKNVISFIKEALDETPVYIEIESEDDEGEPLKIDKNITEESFKSFTETKTSQKFAAIDGGSGKILNGRSFCVDIYRYGYNIFQNDKLIEEETKPPVIQAVSLSNAEEIFKNVYFDLLNETPTEFPTFDRTTDRIRALKEWGLAESLIEKLDSGDIILVDGSLKSSVTIPYGLIKRVCKKAGEAGVHLVGVTKTSTLYWGKRAPLIPMVSKMGNKKHPNQNWFCRLSETQTSFEDSRWFGDIYVAKLSPESDFAFRVDVNRLDSALPEKIFSSLSSISQDPVYMGYPYPLASIHNKVRIKPGEMEDFRYHLEGFALTEGINQQDWEMIFANFHKILDVNE